MTLVVRAGLAGPVPDDHDCEACGCLFPESGMHSDENGFCLACGGCGDPMCCSHDEMCVFDYQVKT